jgi:hypothetical protein
LATVVRLQAGVQEQARAALETLTQHDVVGQREDGRYAFTVELMRRWVVRRRGWWGGLRGR